MRNKHGHLSLAVGERLGDLPGCKHQPSGRVEYEIDRLIRRRQPYRAQHRLRVLDIDVTLHRHTEDARAFLPVNHRDHARLPFGLKLLQHARAAGLCIRRAAEDDQERDQDKEQPETEPRNVGKGEPDTADIHLFHIDLPVSFHVTRNLAPFSPR